jgi:hypothetical protein
MLLLLSWFQAVEVAAASCDEAPGSRVLGTGLARVNQYSVVAQLGNGSRAGQFSRFTETSLAKASSKPCILQVDSQALWCEMPDSVGFGADAVQGLEIQVSPQNLVLSSQGGKLTVHTDVPYGGNDQEVELWIRGEMVAGFGTFPDNQGNLVVQIDRERAKELIEEFEGKFTTAVVGLAVDGDYAEQTITVKK